MKVKKMFKSSNLGMRYVVQKCDGGYASFMASPFREIREEDLKRMPFFRAIGKNAEEAEEFMYNLYGLEKERW